MKHLANTLSISRIMLALSLFFVINNVIGFIIIYTIAWITDALDGKVARLTKSSSDFGSKLDDLGDTITIICMGIIMILWLRSSFIRFIPFIGGLIAVRIFNMLFTKYKYGKVYISHTYSSKALGFIVLSMPIIYILTERFFIIYTVLIASIAVSLEETMIHLVSTNFEPLRRTIFYKPKISIE